VNKQHAMRPRVAEDDCTSSGRVSRLKAHMVISVRVTRISIDWKILEGPGDRGSVCDSDRCGGSWGKQVVKETNFDLKVAIAALE
jgi:hypothetical protein